MIGKNVLFVALVVSWIYSIVEGKPDRTQLVFEQRLAQFPNRQALKSNETFHREMFTQFRHDHPRPAQMAAEETTRYENFQQTLGAVLDDQIYNNRTFTVGLNKFSDWTTSELEILRGNRVPVSAVRAQFVTAQITSKTKPTAATIPATFDYTARVSAVNRSVSILRPVRDQGQCGSCYAFAMIALVEAQYAFQYGQGVNMSEQQIVDCSTGDYGCVGGYFDTSFNYLNSIHWFMNSATNYPYTGVANNCSASKTVGYSVGNLVYRHLPSENATAMQQALITYGPLWVSLYVGSDCSGTAASTCPVTPAAAAIIMSTFQSYTGGIFQAAGCVTSADNNNHAMALVGFGYDPATKLNYWKFRNSWGEEWGENGYVRIVRGVNMCNVESDVFFLAKPVA